MPLVYNPCFQTICFLSFHLFIEHITVLSNYQNYLGLKYLRRHAKIKTKNSREQGMQQLGYKLVLPRQVLPHMQEENQLTPPKNLPCGIIVHGSKRGRFDSDAAINSDRIFCAKVRFTFLYTNSPLDHP